jgi:hypothetical protein
MKRNLSDDEFHALYCPIKNVKSALFLVVCFSVTTFAGWKALHKPPEHKSIVYLLFYIVVAVGLARLLVAFTCWRERLVISVVIVSILTGAVMGFAPSEFSQHTEMLRSGKLALSLLGLLVSLTMLVQAAPSPNVRPSNAGTSSPSQPRRDQPC